MTNFETAISSSPYEGNNSRFDVLVVEDEPASRKEYVEFLTTLGYSCRSVSHGAEALKIIAATPSIGVVVTDLDMPTMDGLSLLSELQTRFTPFRPLVPIVVTGLITLETAVEAMRSDAIDFLPKPVSPATLTAALRRASARWNMLHGQFRLLSLMELGNSLSVKSAGPVNTRPDPQNPSREVLQKFVRLILKARQRRAEFMDASKFADPAWDIMLDLTSAALEGRSVPALSVSAAANVPMTTALRYVKRLVEDGVVKRWDDPDDKRRSLLALEDRALESMVQYLATVWRSTSAEFIAAS
jgi:CheY-like chemotaxis protein